MSSLRSRAASAEVGFRTCQWIEGERRPFTDADKCGAQTESGQSWCAEHRKRVVFKRLTEKQARRYFDRLAWRG